MNESPPRPAREVRGPALWIKNAEFAGPILLGAALLLLTFLGVGLWAHFAQQRQAESYAVAVTTLETETGITPVAQREAALVRRDGTYEWRAIVWRQAEGAAVPLIWTATVSAERPMTVVATTLAPHDEATARALELRWPPDRPRE